MIRKMSKEEYENLSRIATAYRLREDQPHIEIPSKQKEKKENTMNNVKNNCRRHDRPINIIIAADSSFCKTLGVFTAVGVLSFFGYKKVKKDILNLKKQFENLEINMKI